MSFADRLRSERARMNLTQEQFGALGGVKRVSQYLYEQEDGRVPDINYLLRLKEHGVDVAFLVLGQRQSPGGGTGKLGTPLLLSAFRAVDEFARDQDGELLPYAERERFFQFLCTALSEDPSAGDPVDLRSRLRHFVGS